MSWSRPFALSSDVRGVIGFRVAALMAFGARGPVLIAVGDLRERAR